MKALLIAFSFAMPYHILRCTAAAGAKVSVLGSDSAGLLRRSRYCARYHRSHFDPASEDYDVIAAEIWRVVESESIDIVIPADDVSTRLLILLRDRLGIRTTPLPTMAQFDTLNDKWNFSRFCESRGVRVPATSLYQSAGKLLADINSGEIALPLTVKPTDQSGGRGVLHILDRQSLPLIESANYAPLLVQRHIIGTTVGVSILCDRGRVVAKVMQYRDGTVFRVIHHQDLWDNVDRLVQAIGLHGPANFDAVLEVGTNLGYLVECNPRYWYSVYMSLALGINFLDLSLRFDRTAQAPTTSLPIDGFRLTWLRSLLAPHHQSAAEWRLLRYHLSDPIPHLIERFHLFNDSVAVDHQRMSSMGEQVLAAPPERRDA